jgi:hypothetical protein
MPAEELTKLALTVATLGPTTRKATPAMPLEGAREEDEAPHAKAAILSPQSCQHALAGRGPPFLVLCPHRAVSYIY